MNRHSSPAFLRSLAVAGSLAVAATLATAVAPHAAHAVDPNAPCGASVFVNAYTWNPPIKADDTGSDSVTGSGYSIDFQWTVDWDTKTGTVDAQITSGDYSLIGANVWYLVPAPDFPGDTTEGALPKGSSFAHTQSSSSAYAFNDPQMSSLWSIQLVVALCTEAVPSTVPPTAVPAETDPASTDPASTDPANTEQPTPTTAVSGSGGVLPSTGGSSSTALLAVVAGAMGVVLVRVARRRPRLG